MASCTVCLLISLNITRHFVSGSISRRCARCHEIASPSRSGSVARSTLEAAAASFLISLMVSPLPLIFMYSGSKLSSTFTPSLLLGRSLTWPTDAMTLYLEPRYLLIIFAFDGDSTTSSVFLVFAGAFAAFFATAINFSFYI